MSFKVMCTTSRLPSNDYASNALRFATLEEADTYGHDLAMRWLALTNWRIEECEDPVNYRWADGRAVALP